MAAQDRKIAGFFKALGDENRIRILRMLCQGERCACELLEEMDISQPTLSHHMRILCDAGVVNGRKNGKWMHYSLALEDLREQKALVMQYLCPVQAGVESQ